MANLSTWFFECFGQPADLGKLGDFGDFGDFGHLGDLRLWGLETWEGNLQTAEKFQGELRFRRVLDRIDRIDRIYHLRKFRSVEKLFVWKKQSSFQGFYVAFWLLDHIYFLYINIDIFEEGATVDLRNTSACARSSRWSARALDSSRLVASSFRYSFSFD